MRSFDKLRHEDVLFFWRLLQGFSSDFSMKMLLNRDSHEDVHSEIVTKTSFTESIIRAHI